MDGPSLRNSVRWGFDKIAADYASLRAAAAGRETRTFVRWIQPEGAGRILDAACGPATLARTFDGRARQIHALDISERMIHLARRSAGPSAQVWLTVGDVEHLPYASKSFQLVTCAYAFANFPDPLKVLREFTRVTDRKGRVAIMDVVAPEDPVKRWWLNQIEGLRSQFHTRILARSQFADLFRGAGLRLESSEFHRCYRSWREWLRLSPAAGNPEQARRLREALLECLKKGKASLVARHKDGRIVLCYQTARFLLRRA